MLTETQLLSSRINAINEIASVINRMLDLEAILKVVGRQARWLIDFDHCSVCIRQGPQSWQTHVLCGKGGDMRAADDAIQTALCSGHPQIRTLEASETPTVFCSQLVMPLESEGEILGTLNFAAQRPGLYHREEVRVAYLLAVQVATAIRTASRFAEIQRLKAEVEQEKRVSDDLLHNILPNGIVSELKQTGHVEPVHFQSTTVLFTDFENFTPVAAMLSPRALLDELSICFSAFDRIVERYNLEKLKTNGDSYMCVGGVPIPRDTHALDSVLAALEIRDFMQTRAKLKQQQNLPYWGVRIGIHTGPLVAGVIGHKKFAYDVWGDTVNVASRMESSGKAGAVNISQATYRQIYRFFHCQHRGRRKIKGKDRMDMYSVIGMRASPLPLKAEIRELEMEEVSRIESA